MIEGIDPQSVTGDSRGKLPQEKLTAQLEAKGFHARCLSHRVTTVFYLVDEKGEKKALHSLLELLTTIRDEAALPRKMTPDERRSLLKKLFDLSYWE